MEKGCTGFGHRVLWGFDRNNLQPLIESLIENHNVKNFYTGGMGDFDHAFIAAVRMAKIRHPNIRLYLVVPYYSNKYNVEKDYYEDAFDDIIFPDECARIHPKAAIRVRNFWLVEHCDYIVGFITKSYGGAYTAIRHAYQNHKTVFLLNDTAP